MERDIVSYEADVTVRRNSLDGRAVGYGEFHRSQSDVVNILLYLRVSRSASRMLTKYDLEHKAWGHIDYGIVLQMHQGDIWR